MTPFRRPLPTSRIRASRAGILAFGILLALGVALGLAIGHVAAQRVRTAAANRLWNEASDLATELGRGLGDRRNAMRLLAEMPSVNDHSGEESEAYAGFLKLYPEFESVSVGKPTPISPGKVRLIVPLRGRSEKVYGTLARSWPTVVVGRSDRFGRHEGSTTLLVSPGGVLTEGAGRTPAWRNLTRRIWKVAVVHSRGGLRSMVAKAFVPKEGNLMVLASSPMSAIDDQVASVRLGGFAFGAVLGLVTGIAAWFVAARATRRLRRENVALERRVAKRTEKLAAAERAFRGIFENAPLGLYECDASGRFLRVNPQLARILGFESPAAMIKSVVGLKGIGDAKERAAFLERLRADGEAKLSISAQRKDGAKLWLSETARLVVGEGGVPLIEGAIQDASAQRELEERLRLLSSTDALTGLLNRRGLAEAIASAELPVSFVVMDVDRFKHFNDTYGHPAGDAALQSVAETLRESVRAGGAVARAGGEEFVVVLPGTGVDEARHVAETLREAVAARNILNANLTISGGVAQATRTNEVEEAFVAADRALYLAKQGGRNRIVVNSAKLV